MLRIREERETYIHIYHAWTRGVRKLVERRKREIAIGIGIIML